MHHYLKAKFGKATNITLEGKFKDVDRVTTKTVPVDDLEIMQFTGLLDKNGKEIFEGDVVKLFGNETVSQVYFKDGSFLIDEPEKKTLLFCILCEVIGNIHEHPELLKQL
jgi:hypothetical protein